MSDDLGKIYGADLLRVTNGMRVATDPRVVAILPCSFLEGHLTTLLERKLPGLEDKDLWKRFFGASGMLIDLGKKLDVALALQAITPKLHKRIVTIARIRNRLAHRLNVTDFDHPEVAPLVASLASHNSPAPRIVVNGELVPYLRENSAGLFVREAISACGSLTNLLTDGEGFEYTDVGIPVGMPGTSRSITFGGTRTGSEDLSLEGQ